MEIELCKKLSPIFLSILLGSCSCGQNKDLVPNETAVKLNNMAMYLMARNHTNEDSLKKCVDLIDSAISLDPNNWTFYHNKWTFLYDMGLFDSALRAALNGVRTDSMNYKLALDAAMALDTLKKKDSATVFYNKTLYLLDRTSVKNPRMTLMNDYQKIVVLILSGADSEHIQKVINDFEVKYKDSPNVALLIAQIKGFNKQIYMMYK